MAFTDADMAGKVWLSERIEAAGLELSIDGAANVSGTLAGDESPRITVGSHIDTVPCAARWMAPWGLFPAWSACAGCVSFRSGRRRRSS